jgi:predicted TPR repeat methyltransferase
LPDVATGDLASLEPFQALQVAVKWHRAGRVQAAAEVYRRVLELDAFQVDALHFLGLALHQLGRSEEGISSIRRALELDPCCLPAINNLGNVLEEAGRLTDAELTFRHLVELAPPPGSASALNNLGVVLGRLGRLDEAVPAYQQAVHLEPRHAEAWHNLGNALKRLGKVEESLSAYREAIQLRPYDAKSYLSLGRMLYAVGRPKDAVAVYQAWLASEPGNPVATHMVAGLTGREVPERASKAFVTATFDSFSDTFDEVLAGLDYRAPALVSDVVKSAAGSGAGWGSILDAGCGTGLCGPLLRSFATSLTGVDLSPRMLAHARGRGVYDELVEAELEDYLRDHQGVFDVVASADTLCYFGDLRSVLVAAEGALRAGGLFVFTVEQAEQEPPNGYRIEAHGRYCHGMEYVTGAMVAAGFAGITLERAVLRSEAGKRVAGLVVSGKKKRGGQSFGNS